MDRNISQKLATATVDFDKPGKQVGFFHIPLSVHDDAWGVVPVPVAVIKNGEGPTVILEGGNHGDEYEGPITLGELIRDLDPADVQGRLIFIPAINLPAVNAARRTSPIDEINMNRTFPGDPLGTTTRQIAAYVNDVIFPMGDVFIDLHSGGSSLDIIPSSVIEPGATPAQHAANVAAAKAFGTAIAVVIGTEMAGGGTVSVDALALCRRGVRNVLAHLGVLPARYASPVTADPRLYDLGPKAHVIAEDDGVYEPLHKLGTAVEAGHLAGRIHFLANPGRAPVDLHYRASGILYGRRQPGRVRPGNCCFVVASPYEAPAA